MPVIIASAVVVIGLLALGAGLLGGPGQDEAAPVEPSVPPTSTAPAVEDPHAELEEIRTATRAEYAEELEGSWVVQLSAKQPGLHVEGRTWDEQAILDGLEDTRERHEDAILIYTADWSTYEQDDYWVVVLSTPHDSAAEALEVCEEEGYARDACYAKKLSTTDGPEGASKLLPQP